MNVRKFQLPLIDWGFLLISCCFIGSFLIDSQWRFILATPAILVCGRCAYGKDWLQGLGLCIPKRQIPGILTVWFGFTLCSGLLLPALSQQAGLEYLPYTGQVGFFWKLALIFQVLNEEILLRALLLPKMMRCLNSENKVMVFTGLVFYLLHALLYTYLNDSQLSQATLLTLLFFCLITNLLYLRTGHIAFSFTLHAGWNLNRFAADYQQGSYKLTEAQSLNAIEGQLFPWILFLLGCIWIFWPKVRKGHEGNSPC